MKIVKNLLITALIFIGALGTSELFAAQKSPEDIEMEKVLETSRLEAEALQAQEAKDRAVFAESKRLADEQAATRIAREASLREQYERDLKRVLEESGKKADEAKKAALKNVGWTAKDAAAKKAWEAYQNWDATARQAINKLSAESSNLAQHYHKAYEALTTDQQKNLLWRIMDYSLSSLLGSAPLNADQLKTLNAIINDVRQLPKLPAVEELANYMRTLSQAAAKRVQSQPSKSGPQKPAPPAPKPELDIKKSHEASTIKNVTIVWVDVKGQINATCGLHAVYNPFLMRQSLESNESPEKRAERMIRHRSEDFCALEKEPTSNMLPPDLMQAKATKLGIDEKSYSILANVLQLVDDFTAARPSTRYSAIPENLPLAIKQLQTSPHAIHNFVLGNASMNTKMVEIAPGHFVERLELSPGHYIGVTAEKKGDTLTLYAMDSLDEPKPQNLVQALQAIIQRADYNALQSKYTVDYLVLNKLPEHFRKAGVAQGKNDYKTMLTELRAIIIAAQKVMNHPDLKLSISHDPTRIPVKELVSTYLNKIIESNASNYYKTQAQNEKMNL